MGYGRRQQKKKNQVVGDVGGATRGEKKGAKWRIKEKTVGALRTQRK